MYLRLALIGVTAIGLYGVDTHAPDSIDHVRKSVPVTSATRVVLNAEIGGIQVEPASGKAVDVEVVFRGNAPSQQELDRMVRDFTLDVSEQGSSVRISGTF